MKRPPKSQFPEIPRAWIKKWGRRGIPRLLMEELALFFVTQPSSEDENARLLRELPDPRKFKYSSRRRSKIRSSKSVPAETLYRIAEIQGDKGNRVRKELPLLRLADKTNEALLREGLRRVFEDLIGYQPDPRRSHPTTKLSKKTAQRRGAQKFSATEIHRVTEECRSLLEGLCPLTVNLLRLYCLQQKPCPSAGVLHSFATKNTIRKRVTLLAHCILGIGKRTRGLLQWLSDLYAPESPARIRAINDQAFRRSDGSEIPIPKGARKAVSLAAGFPSSQDTVDTDRQHIRNWSARNRGRR